MSSDARETSGPDLSPERLAAVGLRLRVEGALATVTLDNPASRNAQTPATWRALADLGDGLDSQVRVVILRAEGPSFSAGIDRRMFTPEGVPGEPSFARMASLPDAELDGLIAGAQRAFSWWRDVDVVSIAAVGGHAVGAGFQLALACDLRVLADDAQLAMRETALGLVPDLGGTGALVDLLGYPRALEICATGRWVLAAEAGRLGLAELVVPRAELDRAARELAAAILASPAGAVAETKRLLRAAGRRADDQRLAAEREAQARRLRDLATGR